MISFHNDQHGYPDWEGHYSLSQAREILLGYWSFLASGPAWKQTELTRWEVGNYRLHPLRTVLQS